ncbi:hypothetical protein JHN49_17885, partial [Streptomyces sp. MBT57]|nr:hypothetical protein [Streptomyces sp. MBT57]
TASSAGWINECGTTVGYSKTAAGVSRAVKWKPDGGVVRLKAVPGTTSSQASSINASNVIVGNAYVGTTSRAVKWNTDNTVTELPPLPGNTAASAYGVNDHGTVIGVSIDASGLHRAVKWSANGTITALGNGDAFGVNNSGAVAGFAPTPAGPLVATLWKD